MSRHWSTIALVAVLAASPVAADPGGQLGKGKFLVAKRHLWDPNFTRTVVLLVDHGPQGAMGLVINRSSEVKIETVVPDLEGVGGRPDTVFLGGPVAREMMILLLRADEEPEGALQVFADVYVSSSPLLLERLIGEGAPPHRLRAFTGHAGWAPGQLEAEVGRGDWLIWPADADTVFDREPEEVWPRLIRRDQDLVAVLGKVPWCPAFPL